MKFLLYFIYKYFVDGRRETTPQMVVNPHLKEFTLPKGASESTVEGMGNHEAPTIVYR
jgi:hypothetical protein